jgi:hypothetical protein
MNKLNRPVNQLILFTLLLPIACSTGKGINITNNIGYTEISVINLPKSVNEKLEMLKSENKGENVVIAEATNNPEVLSSLEKLDVNKIRSMHIEKDSTDGNSRSFIILVLDSAASANKHTEETYMSVEQPAAPATDLQSYLSWLQKNIEYPASAKSSGITGKVVLEFNVQKDGQLSDIKVQQGIGGGCDEEAIRVLRLSPPWNSGLQRGKPVVQKMNLSIVFSPDNSTQLDAAKNHPIVVKESLSISNKQQKEADGSLIIEGSVTFHGTPVPDVNIVLGGTTEGTFTSQQGIFKFKTKAANGTLFFSHISFNTGEVKFAR